VIIVDINVVSELMRPSLSPQVRGWVSARAPGELGTRVITAAEIRYRLDRIDRLAEGAASNAC
jgi:predicted nucleic acid-binding protein